MPGIEKRLAFKFEYVFDTWKTLKEEQKYNPTS